MRKNWMAFVSGLRILVLTVGLGGGVLAGVGCVSGPEDVAEESAAEVEELEPQAADEASPQTEASTPRDFGATTTRRYCRRHSDCFGGGDGASSCCNRRCVKPVPGIRCNGSDDNFDN